MIDLRGKVILVTGSTGFLGSHVVNRLKELNLNVACDDPSWDLRHAHTIETLFQKHKPNHVIHCASNNGGIVYNKTYPAHVFFDNTVMSLSILEACKEFKIEKLVLPISSCIYPDDPNLQPFKEDSVFVSPPHTSVACHAYAKRNLVLGSQFYRQEYGVNSIPVCFNMLFGGGDRINPERTKVLTAMVVKLVNAKKSNASSVTFFGTGEVYREFTYVKDAADSLLWALSNYDSSEMINLGPATEMKIKDLAEKIAEFIDYEGDILWDTTKPDGQLRKALSYDKYTSLLSEKNQTVACTTFDDALRETINFYMDTL